MKNILLIILSMLSLSAHSVLAQCCTDCPTLKPEQKTYIFQPQLTEELIAKMDTFQKESALGVRFNLNNISIFDDTVKLSQIHFTMIDRLIAVDIKDAAEQLYAVIWILPDGSVYLLSYGDYRYISSGEKISMKMENGELVEADKRDMGFIYLGLDSLLNRAAEEIIAMK